MRASVLRRFYEHNTRRFLLLSGAGGTQAIHRAVWADGVDTRTEAFEYPNRLVHDHLRQIGASRAHAPACLDLGCGVGGTIFYLAEHAAETVRYTGVTLSPLQVRLARAEAERRGVSDRCRFVEADFLHLPPLGAFDLACAIEAFVLAADADRFFAGAAQALRPGGRLVVIDDFLTAVGADASHPAKQQSWLDAFRAGWHADGLATTEQTIRAAERQGLHRIEERDLTAYLDLGRFRDRLIAAFVAPWALRFETGPYLRMLAGGDALQRCLRHGLVAYRCLVFERGA